MDSVLGLIAILVIAYVVGVPLVLILLWLLRQCVIWYPVLLTYIFLYQWLAKTGYSYLAVGVIILSIVISVIFYPKKDKKIFIDDMHRGAGNGIITHLYEETFRGRMLNDLIVHSQYLKNRDGQEVKIHRTNKKK